jgi:hypothetical protein
MSRGAIESERGEIVVIFRRRLKCVRNIQQPVLHSKVKKPPDSYLDDQRSVADVATLTRGETDVAEN